VLVKNQRGAPRIYCLYMCGSPGFYDSSDSICTAVQHRLASITAVSKFAKKYT